jgi:Leucine-rich repeat (LRR) protein
LDHNSLSSLPDEIGKLIKLQILDLSNNCLTSLPLAFALKNCQSCPVEITRFSNLKSLSLDEDSYEINNLDPDCQILILGSIKNPITNLPYGLKTIYLKKNIDISMIKIPFGCEIIYDFDNILYQSFL